MNSETLKRVLSERDTNLPMHTSVMDLCSEPFVSFRFIAVKRIFFLDNLCCPFIPLSAALMIAKHPIAAKFDLAL